MAVEGGEVEGGVVGGGMGYGCAVLEEEVDWAGVAVGAGPVEDVEGVGAGVGFVVGVVVEGEGVEGWEEEVGEVVGGLEEGVEGGGGEVGGYEEEEFVGEVEEWHCFGGELRVSRIMRELVRLL